METNRNRRAFRSRVLALLAVLPAVSCVDGGGISVEALQPEQPRLATYDCGEDGKLVIKNNGPFVQVTDAGGAMLYLAASPPGQEDRYSAEHYALVVGDGEALFMKSGVPPLACRR